MKKLLYILIIGLTSSYNTIGQPSCTANTGTGDWDVAGTWSCGVVPTNPTYNEVIIPAGSTVEIPTGVIVNFDGTIEVYGTLTVDPVIGSGLGRLLMDDASSIEIYTNGILNGYGLIIVGDPPGFSISVAPTLTEPGGAFTGPVSVNPDGTDQPLPVELMFFNASDLDDVKLSWATAMEFNFDYFSLERSADGENFKEIVQIVGSGENTTSRTDYSYTDESPFIGTSYYRLTSIDFDGYSEIFDYVIVKTEGLQEDFSVFPNPVEGNQFNIQTNFDIESSAELVIYNNVGRVEASYSVDDWLTTFESLSLQPGSYIFKLATSNGVAVHRVLVK